MSGWERTAQVALLVASGSLIALMFRRWERDEQVERMGIAESDWVEKRAKVRKAMSDPWERAWRKCLGVKRLGDQKLNGSKQ